VKTEQRENHEVKTIHEQRADSTWPRAVNVLMLGLVVVVGLSAPGAWLEKLGLIGSAISPQRPEHALFLAGTALPLEARMLGIQLGFLSALAALLLCGRAKRTKLPAWPQLIVLLGFVVLMGLDGLNATLFDNGLSYAYVPDNWLRLGTGLLNGLAVGVIALTALNALGGQPRDEGTAIAGWRELAALVALEAVLFGAIVGSAVVLPSSTGLPSDFGVAKAALYLFGTLGVFGELVMLVAINTLFCLTVARWFGMVRIWERIPLIGVVVVMGVVEMWALLGL
jgi:uncharacterized membrane protein